MNTHMDGVMVEQTHDAFELRGMRVHLIGIGGSGMIGAAALLLGSGARVTGSDREKFEGIGKLVSAGATVVIGHGVEVLDPRTDLVVISAAIPETNPELIEARQRNIRVIKYAELVGLIMRQYASGVAIAGTHGKTTTSAITAYLCSACGLSPSFLIGAPTDQLGGNAGLGEGELFIAESCEYDRSFLHLEPRFATVLNVEADHLDCYPNIDSIINAFEQFVQRVKPDGMVICNGDDPLAMQVAHSCLAPVETFGFGDRVDWRALPSGVTQGCIRFDVLYQGQKLFSTALSIPGRHNVANAMAAIALTYQAGGDPMKMSRALPDFRGVARRLTLRGVFNGVTVVDDYAHHPTEIMVSLQAVREQYQPNRICVVFQPHQAARTFHFMESFADSLADVDQVFIPKVFGAREDDADESAMRSQQLVEQIGRRGGRASYLPTLKEAAEHVAQYASEGDLVITMGAGDVWKVADELVQRIFEPNRV